MIVLILPGFSPKNKEWAYRAKEYLGEFDADVYEWPHWESGKDEDFDHVDIIGDIFEKYYDKNLYIVAKSVGTLITSFLVLGKQEIQKIVLCGIPLSDFDEEAKAIVSKALPLFPQKTVLFQNEFDNHGSYAEVKAFLKDVESPIQIIKKNRFDHEYPYFEEFKELMK